MLNYKVIYAELQTTFLPSSKNSSITSLRHYAEKERKNLQKNLVVSQKHRTFAPAFDK